MDQSNKLRFDLKTSQKIMQLLAEVEKFQGKWETIGFKETAHLRNLRLIATVQSVGSSTRIEGSTLNDSEVQTLLDNLKVQDLSNRDEQEVAGYWYALDLIIEQADFLPLSESYILQFHSILLQFCHKDESQRGKYKVAPNKIVATSSHGIQRTIFHATAPHLVTKEMNDTIEWTNHHLSTNEINPIIVIATFIYEFLSIHPFHDGNGRLSRLLTTLLLLKKEYNFVQYVSFEHIIEERKKEYYQVLMNCQRRRGTEEEAIGSWIIFFLECLLSLSRKLENKLEAITYQDKYVSQRQKEIISTLQSGVKYKVSEIHNQFSDVTIHAIKKDLSYLSQENIIQKSGSGKGTVYFMNAFE